MSAEGYRVGVLGATGAVGSTVLEVLAERSFPVAELIPLASARSAGRSLSFAGGQIEVREISHESIRGLDIVISSAVREMSFSFAPLGLIPFRRAINSSRSRLHLSSATAVAHS